MQPEIHRHYRRCYLGGGPLADRRCKLVMAVCNAGSHTGAGWSTLDVPPALPTIYWPSAVGDMARCEVANAR